MKTKFYFFFYILISVVFHINAQTNPRHVSVKGYYRSNGTYVQPHHRTAPNSTNRDNFSTIGNVNPYTGQSGWIKPDNKYNSTPINSPNNSIHTPTTYNYNSDVSPPSDYNNKSSDNFNSTYTNYIPTSEINLTANNSKTKTIIAYVNTTFLNVRVGPSTDYSIKTKLYAKNKIEIVKVLSEDWIKINYFEENTVQEGYISSIYISNPEIGYFENGYSYTKSTDNKNENFKIYFLNTTGFLREKPNAFSKEISEITKGSEIKLFEKMGDYWRANYRGLTGYINDIYVSERLLTQDKVINTQYIPANNTINYSIGYVDTEGYLREYPNTTNTILTIPSKSKVNLIRKDVNNYWYVEYKGTYGYLSQAFIMFK